MPYSNNIDITDLFCYFYYNKSPIVVTPVMLPGMPGIDSINPPVIFQR